MVHWILDIYYTICGRMANEKVGIVRTSWQCKGTFVLSHQPNLKSKEAKWYAGVCAHFTRYRLIALVSTLNVLRMLKEGEEDETKKKHWPYCYQWKRSENM